MASLLGSSGEGIALRLIHRCQNTGKLPRKRRVKTEILMKVTLNNN